MRYKHRPIESGKDPGPIDQTVSAEVFLGVISLLSPVSSMFPQSHSPFPSAGSLKESNKTDNRPAISLSAPILPASANLKVVDLTPFQVHLALLRKVFW